MILGIGDIPNAPVTLRTPATADAIFSIVMVGLAIVALSYGAWLWRAKTSPVPLLIVLGGGLSMLIEPVVDVLGGCWWPRVGGWHAFNLFGTPVPVWAAACYFWYVGGQALIAWNVMNRRPDRRNIWMLWVAFAGADLALEIPATLLHIYKYFGHQPLNIGGLPLWWPPVNGAMALTGGLLVWRMAPRAKGLAILAMVPLVAVGDGLANGAAGFPAWLALHSNWPMPVAEIAGVAVYGLAALLVWTLAELVLPPTAEHKGLADDVGSILSGRNETPPSREEMHRIDMRRAERHAGSQPG